LRLIAFTPGAVNTTDACVAVSATRTVGSHGPPVASTPWREGRSPSHR